MIHSSTDYAELIHGLLPRGRLWNMLSQDPVFTDLIGALGEELARVEGRGRDILDETDPRSTDELLPEWEHYYALPDPCTDVPDTIQARQAALHAKRIASGGQSRAYFVGVAAAQGFTITITEYQVHNCILDCMTSINGQDWAFAWQVNAPQNTITEFNCQSGCTEPLRDWGNAPLECLINRVKPAHTHVLFSYS